MFNVLLRIRNFFWDRFVNWLIYEEENRGDKLSDFERLRYELKPGDVLLVEGRSKVADITKLITQSIWTHSCLYLGKIHDISNPELRAQIQKSYDFADDEQLIIESLLSDGTIVDNIEKYKGEHLRICRPTGLSHDDTQKVFEYAIQQLGTDYDIRHLLDLARFMFPYNLLPRRWRSTLFHHNTGRPTETICSTMMAEAFASVHYPIRPIIHQTDDGRLKLHKRNSKLISPPDFDYSPYFDVIKYPLLEVDELAIYRKLPWDKSGLQYDEVGDCYVDNPFTFNSIDKDADVSQDENISK